MRAPLLVVILGLAVWALLIAGAMALLDAGLLAYVTQTLKG